MIAVTLIKPTVAIVEERYDLDHAWAYQTNMNLRGRANRRRHAIVEVDTGFSLMRNDAKR